MAELKVSDAEWAVMEVVWQRGEATAADVIAELASAKGWNHRTIRTLLSRLVEKGALDAVAVGNRYAYSPRVSRAKCVRQASRSFLKKVFAGDTGSLLSHFVRDPHVTREDLAQLRELLDERLNEK